jgi:hypothetical protein
MDDLDDLLDMEGDWREAEDAENEGEFLLCAARPMRRGETSAT